MRCLRGDCRAPASDSRGGDRCEDTSFCGLVRKMGDLSPWAMVGGRRKYGCVLIESVL